MPREFLSVERREAFCKAPDQLRANQASFRKWEVTGEHIEGFVPSTVSRLKICDDLPDGT
jgi:hypothetical protein